MTSSPLSRRFVTFTAIVSVALGLTTMAQQKPSPDAPPGELMVHVGTYTGPDEQGHLPSRRLDMATGALAEPVLAAETPSPAFLALHPSRDASSTPSARSATSRARRAGSVSAFAIDREDRRSEAAQSPAVAAAAGRATSRPIGRQARPGRELRRRQRRGAADRAGRQAAARSAIRAAQGQERQPGAAEGAARPLDQPRPGRQLRLRRRPRTGQGAGLPLRRGAGKLAAERPAGRRRSSPARARATSPSTRRGVRLRHQRDGAHRHRVRATTRRAAR